MDTHESDASEDSAVLADLPTPARKLWKLLNETKRVKDLEMKNQ